MQSLKVTQRPSRRSDELLKRLTPVARLASRVGTASHSTAQQQEGMSVGAPAVVATVAAARVRDVYGAAHLLNHPHAPPPPESTTT
jgi:hypothetical protein